MVKVEPTPSFDWSCTSPPWLWAIWRTIDRPSPVPPSALERPLSARQNRSKTRGWCSGAIPGPSSETAIQASPRSLPTARRMREPLGASRTAFSSRLATARLSASPSPMTTTPGATARSSTIPRASAGARNSSLASVTARPRSTCSMAKVDLGREVHLLDGEGWRLAASQGEQVVDQPCHAVAGALDHDHRLPQLVDLRVLVGEGEVRVGADDRQRVAELVRGV